MITEPLRKRIPSAEGPADASQANWIGFAVRQTGQLEKSNDRGDAVVSITDECSRQNKQITEDVKKRTRPWWKVF